MFSRISGSVRSSAATLAALACLCGAGWAAEARAAGIALEVNASRTDGGALSDLQGGARLRAEAVLTNPGPEPLRLLSLRLTGEGAFSPLGAEAAEAVAEGPNLLIWGAEGVVLAPGASRRASFSMAIPPESTPDTDLLLNFQAQGAPLEGAAEDSGEARSLRAETSMALHLAPARLILERALPPESSNPLAHGDSLRVILGMEIPAGRLRDLALALEIPPSAETSPAPALTSSIGADLRCTGGEPPALAEQRLVWRLGDCRLAPGAPAAGRRVELSARFRLRDADPFLSAEEAAAWRSAGFRARLEAGGETKAEAAVSAQMGGPLIAGILLNPPEERLFQAGDSAELRYEIRNLGDAPARDLEFWARPDEALDCLSANLALTPEGTRGAGPCGFSASPPGGLLAPGASLTAVLQARARPDAPLGAPMRLGLDAAGADSSGKAPRMRVHSLELAPRAPTPPRLILAEPRDWTEGGAEYFARPGDAALLEASFQPPKGVGRATLLIQARLLEEDSGLGELVPFGPAPLLLERPEPDPESALWMEAPLVETPPTPTEEDGWRVLRIPLGVLRVPPEAESPIFRIRAPVRIDPLGREARADRRLEIRAALMSGGPEPFGETRLRVESEESIFVDLLEPDLALTAVTDDSDRLIRPGESAEFSGDVCNLGEAAARGVALEAQISPGWDLAGPEAPRLRRSDSDWPILEDAPVLRASTPYDQQSRLLRLEPGVDWEGELAAADCLRLSFHLTASAQDRPEDRSVLFRLGSYEAGAEPRIYEAPTPARIQLRESRLVLGPGGESLAKRGGPLRLEGRITAPPTGGPYQISWRLRSAANLKWRVFTEGSRDLLPTNFTLAAGQTRAFRMESLAPSDSQAGWTETLAIHATAAEASGAAYPAAARWVLRLERDAEAASALTPTKTMAADRNCDGDLADETPQDALFERYKDLRPGECLIFRIRLRNGGETPLEDVVLSETPQQGLRYIPGSATIGPTAEGFLLQSVREPTAQSPLILWRFDGPLPPGAEAEARYGAKAPGGSR